LSTNLREGQIPISPAIDIYARELARLQLDGTPVDDFDLQIAATAISRGLIMVTDNVSHLGWVKGVVIENWHKSLPPMLQTPLPEHLYATSQG